MINVIEALHLHGETVTKFIIESSLPFQTFQMQEHAFISI